MQKFLESLTQLAPHDLPEAAKEVVKLLDDTQFLDHRLYCADEEPKRRQTERDRAQAQAELVVELQEAHPELAPKYATQIDEVATLADLLAKLPDWVQPMSRANAYPPASLVKHEGKAWRARRLTDKEPGVPFSGWEDVTADFLRPEPIADGNADGVGTDAPGLITEPEPVTPAPQVQEWYVGATIEQGIPWRHNGQVYVAKTAHAASALNAPGKSTRHWTPLPE